MAVSDAPFAERPRLALIDDDDAFRRLVRRVAEPLGWTIEEFESGEEFLEREPETTAPQLAFLDLMMPDKDGIETIPELAARYPHCRVVIATGAEPSLAEAAHMIGEHASDAAISVLPKPASLSELRHALSQVEQ